MWIVNEVITIICWRAHRSQDPEDDPNFSTMNPTWEDSLDEGIVDEQGKLESNAKVQQAKLQNALNAIANANSGIFIGINDSIAARRWKNAYLTIKKLLVCLFNTITIDFLFLLLHDLFKHNKCFKI
jgi:hypothetical protein